MVPRGDKLLYSAGDGGQLHLYAIDLPGSEPHQITFGDRNDAEPDVNPNPCETRSWHNDEIRTHPRLHAVQASAEQLPEKREAARATPSAADVRAA